MSRLRTLFLLTCAAFSSLVGSGASAAVLTPVGVTATSSFPFTDVYRPERLIDGSGLAGGLHDADFNTMFLTAQEDQQARLTFDLGARYALTGASLWNYNFGAPGFFSLLRRGVRDFSISLSDDGRAYTRVFGGTLAQGTGAALAAETFAFAGQGRFVALDILSNHASGDYDANDTASGLSEIRFSGSAVPEPTAWAMMIGGMGLAGGMMRARRNRRGTPATA
ncbi:MAG: discoidin domain-containing protein [Sphingomonas sp.]